MFSLGIVLTLSLLIPDQDLAVATVPLPSSKMDEISESVFSIQSC